MPLMNRQTGSRASQVQESLGDGVCNRGQRQDVSVPSDEAARDQLADMTAHGHGGEPEAFPASLDVAGPAMEVAHERDSPGVGERREETIKPVDRLRGPGLQGVGNDLQKGSGRGNRGVGIRAMKGQCAGPSDRQ